MADARIRKLLVMEILVLEIAQLVLENNKEFFGVRRGTIRFGGPTRPAFYLAHKLCAG